MYDPAIESVCVNMNSVPVCSCILNSVYSERGANTLNKQRHNYSWPNNIHIARPTNSRCHDVAPSHFLSLPHFFSFFTDALLFSCIAPLYFDSFESKFATADGNISFFISSLLIHSFNGTQLNKMGWAFLFRHEIFTWMYWLSSKVSSRPILMYVWVCVLFKV